MVGEPASETMNTSSIILPGPLGFPSMLVQDGVHYPATANVLHGYTAMVQHFLVVAASFFQGVGQDRHAAEVAPLVNGPGQRYDAAVVPAQPGRVQLDWVEGIADQIAE